MRKPQLIIIFALVIAAFFFGGVFSSDRNSGGLPGFRATALSTSTTYSVTTGGTSALIPVNGSRNYLRCQNIGQANQIDLFPGTATGTSGGVRLQASSSEDAVFEVNANNLWVGAFSAVSVGGNATMTCIEY